MNTIVAQIFANPALCENASKKAPEIMGAWFAMVSRKQWTADIKANLHTAAEWAKKAPTAAVQLRAYLGATQSVPAAPVQVVRDGRFCTDFLYGWPGGRCDLFQLSPSTTAAERQDNRTHKTKFGHTVVCPYMVNSGDGDGKHPVNALANKDHTIAVLTEMRMAGLSIVPIIYSDSHPVSPQEQPSEAARIVKAFDSYVDAWATYLEPLDTAKSDSVTNATGNAVRAATSKQVFIQTHPCGTGPDLNAIRWTKQAWCDGVLVQITHPGSPIATKDAGRIYKALVGAANGKIVIPFEYSWAADDYKLGDAFAAAGAPGVGDGCSKTVSAILPQVLRSAYVPTAIGTGPRIVSLAADGGTARKPYIRFKLEGVDHWNNQGKDNTNGWIVVNGVRVEQMRKGMVRQHLGNAYGTDEHGVSVRKGDTVSIRFEKIDKRSDRTQEVALKWEWDSTR